MKLATRFANPASSHHFPALTYLKHYHDYYTLTHIEKLVNLHFSYISSSAATMSAANMFYGQTKPVNTADILSRSATASPAASQDTQRQAPTPSTFAPSPVSSASGPGVVSGPWNGSIQAGPIPSSNVTNQDLTTTAGFMSNATGAAAGQRPQIQKTRSTPRPGAILTGKQEHCMLTMLKHACGIATNTNPQTSNANSLANRLNTKSTN